MFPMLIQIAALPLILMAVLTSIFNALADFFVRFVTKKIALSAAAIFLFLGLSSAFILSMSLLITTVAVSAPPELAMGWGWFMPDNADECLSAYFAAYTARWVYDTNYNLVFKKGIFGAM